MSIDELRSRVQQSGAKLALIVTIWKGNPRTIRFLYPHDDDALEVRVESAALRREVSGNRGPRIQSTYGVTVEENCTQNALEFASVIASMLGTDVKNEPQPVILGDAASGIVEIRVTDLRGGKLLWTFYHTQNGLEVGPRIRISKFWRGLS
jgi:rRNA maturation protein Rpf1